MSEIKGASTDSRMARRRHGGENPLLIVDGLRVEYSGEARSVIGADRVSFTIGRGEVLGLAGESGCGKSTTANAIMRLLKPPAEITHGTITFDGRDVLAMSAEELRQFRWREVAMVFQSAMNALNPVMTVGDQIIDVLTTHEHISKREARDRAAELLGVVGIPTDRLRSYPHQLSGGMRQRAVIAIGLALNPSLLIMDEPTTALDVVVQQEIMEQVIELKDRLGFSILFITHDISLMVDISDRMGVMYGGRLVEMGPSKEIFSDPLHPYTRALMGAFPPISGPRVRRTGLSDSRDGADRPWARAIADLVEAAPGRWMAPVHAEQSPSASPRRRDEPSQTDHANKELS
ncbi:ABC transporter ATP-binding protein [Actinomyces sp.]|uniref:ABC transporter ATP-binding protein n=1 Tax=Actinomyces sp. TaxID=29317 RepID=UPI0026DAFA9C|nr:ABC transporter ATP-binding protein [Actinomyces sp.]MDO4899222.1 ABC transporter ATP-binding protein [Actinomyces sp.]